MIAGNLTIVTLILTTPHLLTPMYIFIVNLSIIDIASTSNILPKLLVIILTKENTISFAGCITQMYFFVSLTCTEVLLLAAMAYDRYIAICHPLHYVIFMSLRHCIGLSLTSWTVAFLDLSGHAILISNLSFCSSHLIDHFFCDLAALLKMSCSDTSIIELLNYIEGTILGIITFLLTIISYIFIISSVLNIKSSEGRHKAFSTCTAHLSCVTIFYGTIISLYMRPTSSYSPKLDKFFAFLYVVLVPLINPIIYSLKNENIKKALRRKIHIL
ncbi:PREDICTED: olfactory receptor 1019-like [Nanorana parkeri]|uniref:olfactory receptor 1019-like n=1 Tax=Nanorana parkeri TaxID=125878 RepID=UPI000854E9C7|nr:PREDICTED: olfactory receptor 1019-like [Nanorana parkeri]